MKKKVLITGASGFVGYHLIDEALKNNLEVYAAVRKRSEIGHLADFDIQYAYPDFRNLLSLKKELKEKQYDYIIHAAGVTKARSRKEYNTINADYTYNLKNFVFISSLAAIGPLGTLNGLITEDTVPHPITAYGKSKLLAENKLKSISSLNYIILRPTAVYGPRDKGIFIFFKQLTKGFEPYIGNKQQKLSFIYVKDLAKAAIAALNISNQNSYNLSDGNFYDKYELADTTKNILHLKTIKFHLPVNFVKLIAYLTEKVGYLGNKAPIVNIEKINELTAVNWSCGIEKAKYDLGFYPHYDLKAGLTETLNWYKTNNWF
jgi:UDP-glucose 4-epimerase